MTTTISPEDVNRLSSFLAHEQIQIPTTTPTPPAADCIVICVSAILDAAETVFTHLEQCPTLTKTLVLCGGIGHSTPFLYDAVARHPRFVHLAADIQGLPEARVLHCLFTRCFDAERIQSAGCRVLVEDGSTNCGANAIFTKELLRRSGVEVGSVLVVQDPTMARRTVASFEKVFASTGTESPRFASWPVFVPRVALQAGELVYNVPGIPADRLWSLPRFLGLIVGEIPRLRDDAEGYGPKGKGFIAHVDIPEEVEAAWERVKGLDMARR
ncbi:DUF218 domain protein [Aspergillus steynii IBT 23096]|uniref:DUF218 domain protein n=1 Tax=Aspergillus steynii IBT 23096 TaxID=1392250 RepID=A0A2I2G9U3_9EURO|nr:DUF218 domain protein [Aspergillus steynii IBT 23096]PLB49638.1 DUF218 domain protein [Aspergillus steynii IBT 23096]